MEAAGDFITGILPAELAAGMEDGHDHLERGDFALFMDVDGDAAAIIDDAHAISRQKRDLDVIGKTSHSLVAGVVEDLSYKLMRPSGPVVPMYMPGRLRTASRPSKTWIASAP